MMDFARLLNVKYVQDGRDASRDGGLDCWGFSLEYMKSMGMSHIPPQFAITGEEAKKEAFSGQMSNPSWVKSRRPGCGMLVLFRFFSGKYHCGVICEDNVSFAHCAESGVRVDRLDDPLWKRITVGYYSYSGDASNEK